MWIRSGYSNIKFIPIFLYKNATVIKKLIPF